MDKGRNVYVSGLKLLAASFVIFIHVRFPGTFGRVMDCFARFAVPLFFVISGYYSYRIEVKAIKRRLWKVFVIALCSNILYFLYGLFSEMLAHESVGDYLTSIFNIKTISIFIFTGRNPLSEHLWYLTTMILIYLALLVFTKFWKSGKEISYRYIYILAACAFLFQIAFGLKAESADLEINYLIYRYFLFYGFPFFAYGLFLREYGERIGERYHFTCGKEVIMIIAGLALSLLQWFGIGKVEVPLGMIAVVTALALLAFVKPGPSFSAKRIFRGMEIVSAVVYIIHPLVSRILRSVVSKFGISDQLSPNGYLFPLVVLGVSIVIGIAFSAVVLAISGRRRR